MVHASDCVDFTNANGSGKCSVSHIFTNATRRFNYGNEEQFSGECRLPRPEQAQQLDGEMPHSGNLRETPRQDNAVGIHS